jgi:hypothetical protein
MDLLEPRCVRQGRRATSKQFVLSAVGNFDNVRSFPNLFVEAQTVNP